LCATASISNCDQQSSHQYGEGCPTLKCTSCAPKVDMPLCTCGHPCLLNTSLSQEGACMLKRTQAALASATQTQNFQEPTPPRVTRQSHNKCRARGPSHLLPTIRAEFLPQTANAIHTAAPPLQRTHTYYSHTPAQLSWKFA
jgi:hypothetical protein